MSGKASVKIDAYRLVLFSPDGSLLAAIDGENTLHVWDANTRRKLF
jgi:WD40 repeat protein